MKNNKYQNSRIYTIESYSRPDLIYVGSTYTTLPRRLSEHKSDFKKYLKGTHKYMTSFELLKCPDYHINLVENYPCNNREELHARETYFIKTMNCVNKQIPFRTEEEKIELQKIYRTNYKQEHKEDIKIKDAKYRAEHKEQFAKYYEEHKEQISEKRKERETCECGGNYRKSDRLQHKRSKLHQNFVNSQQPCEITEPIIVS